jgi:hypothetical protein
MLRINMQEHTMTNDSQKAYKKIMTLRIITGIIWLIGIIVYVIRANISDNFLQNPVMMILPAATQNPKPCHPTSKF